ncbi:MAG: MlaD family protein, partial [Planctomycetota bacterium]|nr:MlaD family protein [Planctomycetota bacterium]
MSHASSARLELIIGAFILVGILLVAGMILLFGNRGRGLFAASYKVIVDFEHVGNLRPGAPAKLGGYQIGRVADIRLAPHGVEVEVDIAGRDLPLDTVAAISNAGLVGDTFLEFSRGASPQRIPQEKDAARAHHLKGRGLVQMSQIFEQARDIGEALLQALNNLNEVMGDSDFKSNLKKSMANVQATTQKADEFMAGLQNTSEHILTA